MSRGPYRVVMVRPHSGRIVCEFVSVRALLRMWPHLDHQGRTVADALQRALSELVHKREAKAKRISFDNKARTKRLVAGRRKR